MNGSSCGPRPKRPWTAEQALGLGVVSWLYAVALMTVSVPVASAQELPSAVTDGLVERALSERMAIEAPPPAPPPARPISMLVWWIGVLSAGATVVVLRRRARPGPEARPAVPSPVPPRPKPTAGGVPLPPHVVALMRRIAERSVEVPVPQAAAPLAPEKEARAPEPRGRLDVVLPAYDSGTD